MGCSPAALPLRDNPPLTRRLLTLRTHHAKDPLSLENSYARKTISNVAWLGSSQFIRQGAAIGTTIVLARMLSPSDYGIFAMTLFINELAQLFVAFGIGSALIQAKNVDQVQLSTCFWINMLIAGLVAGMVVACGPAAAGYFNQPMVAQLLLVSAVNLVIGAMLVIPSVVLSRALAFDQIALASTLGSLVGAAATIALAVFGAGIWALVLQPLIGTVINLAYLAWRARWWPSMLLHLPALRGIMRFSINLFVDSLASHITRNLQQIIVAPLAGAAAMGMLSLAMTAAWLPVAQFTGAAVRAVYPVLARLTGDTGRFDSGVFRTLALIALLAFPVLIGLAVLAKDVIPLVFGTQWKEAAPLVSMLCILGLLLSVSGIAGSALLAQGRSGSAMWVSIAGIVIVAGCLWAVRESSIFWITVAISASHGLVALLTVHIVLRSIDSGWRMFLGATWRPLACALAMGALVWFARSQATGLSEGARVGLLVVVGAAGYLGLTVLINRSSWTDLLHIAFRKRQ